MKQPRPARGIAMAGMALVALGTSILVLVVEQDQIVVLVAGLREEFAVVAIIILALAGAGLAALLTGEKPRPPARPTLMPHNPPWWPGFGAETRSRIVSPALDPSPLTRSIRQIPSLRSLIACGAFATMRWARTPDASSIAVARFIAKGGWGVPPPEPPPDWRQTAKQVHAELGGDLPVVLRTAERIESRYHHQFERVARDLRQASGIARRRVRYAAWGLSAVVPGTLAARLLIDEGYLERHAGTGITLELAGAALLTLGGTWWLHRLSRHSFSPLPFTARKHKREAVLVSGLANLLDRAAIYAAAGLGVEDALSRAMMADQDAPGARLLPLLSSSNPSDLLSLQKRKSPLARCALTLVRRLEDGVAPVDALALTAADLRIEHAWTRWHAVKKLHLGLALPLLTCILPAVVLLLLQ